MLLSDYFPEADIPRDVEIVSVTSDTRHCEPGALFVAIRGARYDGHEHAAEAAARGAAAVVAEREVACECPVVHVDNTREAYGRLCARYWGDPANRMRLAGVTGTNGKTTITTLTRQVLEASGRHCGLIGTIRNEFADISIPAKYTTPDPSELHALFARMERAGCGYVSMEVSSMALDQRRLSGCRFAVGVFTNLTQDHLDYHGDMETYFAAKRRLFDLCDAAVVCIDDAYGRRLLGLLPDGCSAATYSVTDPAADLFAADIELHERGVAFTLVTKEGRLPVRLAMPGLFAAGNALAVIGACAAVGLTYTEAAAGLARCTGVRGRMEVLAPAPDVPDPGFTVLCDYAHSDDSLEKAIGAVRGFAKGTVWALFGPAGCRDRTKRPKMAAAAAKHADFVVLTSDNPRSEPPAQILADAEPGLAASGKPYRIMENRREAIEWVLREAKPNDVVVLCGKGHENYQVLDGMTVFFDEHELVPRILAEIEAERR